MRLQILVIALLSFSATQAQDTAPRETGLREDVDVRLVQAEVTVWPRDGRTQQCSSLGIDDFELSVRGRPRDLVAVDPHGTLRTTVDGVGSADGPPTALSLVLYFDLWHLDLFRQLSGCPITKPAVFDQARRIVREQLKPGDRLALVTFAGWPTVHTGWIEDPDAALRALDALEVSHTVRNVRFEHSHHEGWVAGLNSLLLALGRYPGSKELIYFGDDMFIRDIEANLFEIASRAQASQVSIYTFDPVDGPCRSMALAGTYFERSRVHAPLANATGGRMFRGQQDATAVVRGVREISGCRYVLSFHSDGREGRGRPRIVVKVRRKGFDVRAPGSFEDPRVAPDERDRQEALFLLPDLRRGLVAEAGLWPLRPTGKRRKNRWSALMLIRLRRPAGTPLDPTVRHVELRAIAHSGGKILTEFSKDLTAADLDAIRHTPEGKLLVLPLEVRAGDVSVAVTVRGGDGAVEASHRSQVTVPRHPRAGEAHPWLLVDRVARAGDRTTLLPSLVHQVDEGRGVVLLGYGCPGDEESLDWTGQMVRLDGVATLDVPIEWLDEPPDDGDCGWLVGTPREALTAGWWRYDPPATLSASGAWRGSLDFRVAPH